MDERIAKLAHNLVNYSVELKKGEKILIEAYSIPHDLVRAIIQEVYKVGGYPYVQIIDKRVERELYMGSSKEWWENLAKYEKCRMEDMDAYIGIRGGNNSLELSDVPSDKMQMYQSMFFYPVHHEIRVNKTKWVILRYPTEGMSLQSNMSTSAFEDFYFNVCNLDYSKMDKAMDSLKELLEKTDKVHIVAPGTDLTFSIKGIPAIKCAGNMNIPDGEVYTAPVKNSVNGTISYNAPSVQGGVRYENVKLTFKDGKIIDQTSNFPEKSLAIFDTDEGARYVGEFAIGVNPYVNKPMGDILFDEKIAGSIHFTPGCAYDNAFNGNTSAVHWDLVLIQTEEYGGGEIYFDDRLIRKNGIFVIDELKCLNPENLK